MSDYTGLEIAIIGMACRYPGAMNYQEFWENLKNGVESIGFYSDEELLESGVPAHLLRNPAYIKAQAQLQYRNSFDYGFFGFAPKEASQMNAQAYVLHETVWSAFEDAGYIPDQTKCRIGVYCGANSSFEAEIKAFLQSQLYGGGDMSTIFLSDKDYIATSIAYKFDLSGPAIVMDTACSTSLVAIHAACQGILNGDCDMAVAGGVALQPSKKAGYLYKEGMIYSKDGHTRPFDADATGTINTDGAGVVVLKLLEQAVADRDHIHAVIKGTAINNDGRRKVGYTAPSIKAQADVIRAAQMASEVSPEQISYLATHGSGTIVGDPIEMNALIQAFGPSSRKYCRIGSVKANIGHTVHAAGVANLMKVTMALKHRQLPPTINHTRLNPMINLRNTPFSVNTTLTEWEANGNKLRAGVSSFGIGGTNAHAILEEAPVPAPHGFTRPYHLLTLSARTPVALEARRADLLAYLKQAAEVNLYDLAFTLQTGRKHFPYRQALLVKDKEDAIARLALSQGYTQQEDELPTQVFVFPGLGMQLNALTWQLYTYEPLFRESLDVCAAILVRQSGFDLVSYLEQPDAPGTNPQALPAITLEQLVTFTYAYAYASMLMRLNVTPGALLGYSFGEYVAACLAGVMSLEDTLALLVLRGDLISRTPKAAMLSVPLAQEKLRELIGNFNISIAIDNRESCIVAGEEQEVQRLESMLKTQRIMCLMLGGQYGIHSLLMDGVLDNFRTFLSSVALHPPKIPYLSCVTGDWITSEEATSVEYWVRHLRDTMRFVDCVAQLKQGPSHLFTIIGRGLEIPALLVRFLGNEIRENIISCPPVAPETDLEVRSVYYQLGRLWSAGIEFDWNLYYGKARGYRVALPTYPFERALVKEDTDILHLIQRVAGGQKTEQTPAGVGSSTWANPESQPAVGGAEIVTVARPALSTNYVPPQSPEEKQLIQIWRDFFGYSKIGVLDDFLELGGDSLKATTIIQSIKKQFGVLISLQEFFKHGNTARKQAEYLKQTSRTAFEDEEIEPAPHQKFYPVVPGQKLVYRTISHYGQEHYVLTRSVVINGRLNVEHFENALAGLIQHNESLRTELRMQEGELVQVVHPELPFTLRYVEDSESSSELAQSSLPTYGLPLFDFELVKVAEQQHRFNFRISHLVCDGISQLFLFQQFFQLYQGVQLQPQLLQFKDFAYWQQNKAAQAPESRNFWAAQLEAAGAQPALFGDQPQDDGGAYQSVTVMYQKDHDFRVQLGAIARQLAVPENVVLLGLYALFVSEQVDSLQVVLGIVVDGRLHEAATRMVGMFSRIMPLVLQVSVAQSYLEKLAKVCEDILLHYNHRDYPFEELVIDAIENQQLVYPFRLLVQFHDIIEAVHQVEKGDMEFADDKYLLGYIPSEVKLDIFREKVADNFHFTYNAAFAPGNVTDFAERLLIYLSKVSGEMIDLPIVPN